MCYDRRSSPLRCKGNGVNKTRYPAGTLALLATLLVACGTASPTLPTTGPPTRQPTTIPAATRAVPTMAAAGTAGSPPTPALLIGADALRTPLHLPALPPGGPCPKVTIREVNPDSALLAAGPGPIYIAGFSAQTGAFTMPILALRGKVGFDVTFFASPDYGGPILVRGQRLDGPGGVAFPGPTGAAPELTLADGAATVSSFGWRQWTSTAQIAGPGCYAFQIDGTAFSEVIVVAVR